MELNVDDYIENRLPDLVANMNQDSDELFDSLLSSNNINFTRSRTCFMDDFQLHQATPLLSSSMSMNSLKSTPSKSKSRTSLPNELQDRRPINIGLPTNNTTCLLSSKTPLKSISSNTLDFFKPRTIKNCSTKFSSHEWNKVYQNSESGHSPYKMSLQYETNDASCNSSKVAFNKTPTRSPHGSSVKKRSSVKLYSKVPGSNEKAGTNGRLLKSCLKEKQKEAVIPGTPTTLQYITFRNKSSQKKENPIVLSCNTLVPDLPEEQSLASKFNLVSACNSSPIPASFLAIESPNKQCNLLKTPVGRCSQPFLKTPNSRQLKEVLARSSSNNNNTPTLSCRTPESFKSLTGFKKLQSSISKRISLPLHEKTSASKHKEMNLVEDDDLPCTQPISEIILRGKCRRINIMVSLAYTIS